MEKLFIYGLLFMRFSLTFANFEIVGSGVVPLRKGDVGMVFFVTVRNGCKQCYQVTGNMVKCRETITGEDPDSSTVSVVGGNMGELQANETRNLSYIFPNLYPYNRLGECQLAVRYRDEANPPKELRVTVPFDTMLGGRTVPVLLRGFVTMRDVRKCKTLDEDPLEKCLPVNCPVKYSGHRSFFNHRLRRCQPVPTCDADPGQEMPDVTYSPISNTCQRAEITEEDIRYLTGTQGRCDEEMKGQPMPFIKNMRCHHGRLDVATGFCVCDNGWGSPPLDPDQFHPTNMVYHMCTIQVRAWTTIYDHEFQARYVFVSIVSVIATMLMICFGFCLIGAYECVASKADLDACYDAYDVDGYKLYHKESRTRSSDNDSTGAVNVCLCDEDEDEETAVYQRGLKKVTVCGNLRGRDEEDDAGSVEDSDGEPKEDDDEVEGAEESPESPNDEVEGADEILVSPNEGMEATDDSPVSPPEEAEGGDVESLQSNRLRSASTKSPSMMRRRVLPNSAPAVLEGARSGSSSDEGGGPGDFPRRGKKATVKSGRFNRSLRSSPSSRSSVKADGEALQELGGVLRAGVQTGAN